MKHVTAGPLNIAYLETGSPDGIPTILLHGFPYDVHSFDTAIVELAASGHRCVVPYLRGFGPTTFTDATTPRSGQQAALALDLLALLDALLIPKAVLAGFDWGGRAASIAAALWPDRVRALVSCGTGYNIQNIVDIVIHSYRHRFGRVEGDSAFDAIEARLAEQPHISVPTIVLQGDSDGVEGPPVVEDAEAAFFKSFYQRRISPSVGHNFPQEAPKEFAAAVLAATAYGV